VLGRRHCLHVEMLGAAALALAFVEGGQADERLDAGGVVHAIKYGIRLTGMPAWGTEASADDDLATWKLVHFIRHLPQITASEVQEMERLNPKSPEETMTDKEEEKFLEGGEAPAATASPEHKRH